MTTHYEVLGVKEDASDREINAAYRRLAKKHHPDRGGDPAFFQRVNDAYTILRSKAEREAYDFEHKFENFLDAASGRRSLRQRIVNFFGGHAFLALSIGCFALGVFLLDAGDGIQEDFNKGLVFLGSLSVLLSVGFFANRKSDFAGAVDAIFRAVASILFFLFDVAMRVYLIFAVVFGVVVLLALINWLKKTYLHFLPSHF
jgi:curved DNA-binding protein CbpA